MTNIFTNGITLNPDAWYMRMLRWVYGVEPSKYKSLCPLFWSVIGTLFVVLPIFSIVKLIMWSRNYKFGRNLCDAAVIIGKWFFVLGSGLILSFCFCYSIDSLIIGLFFGHVGKSFFIVISVILLIIAIVLILFFLCWITDKIDERKKEKRKNKSPKSLLTEHYEKALRKERKKECKHNNPFDIFIKFIIATYHKVCPIIHWSKNTQNN